MENIEPINREIELICEFLNEKLGFTYGLQKKYLINSRLNKRLFDLNLNSYEAYLKLIKNDRTELNYFFDLLTTNVTSFFREDNQFIILQRELLPQFYKSLKTKKIRCWSAGCSSGEEAYSLAIVLNEALGQSWDIKVLASDISTRKLEEGMKGVYPGDRLQDVPVSFREKYFFTDKNLKGQYKVTPELRKQIVFRKINLNQSFDIPVHIKFDIILCRNVFIYLGKESRQKVLEQFYTYLNTGGYLFLGQSEPINTFNNNSWSIIKNCIYQKK